MTILRATRNLARDLATIAAQTILTPLLRRVDAAVVPALDVEDDDEVAQLAAELDDAEERLVSWLRGPAS